MWWESDFFGGWGEKGVGKGRFCYMVVAISGCSWEG